MTTRATVDGVLVQWGDRLFYPRSRSVRDSTPRLTGEALRRRADAVRDGLAAIAARRAPQVMVKVTGGGRGIKAIAAHFRYISKNGRLEIEDENGTTLRGKDAVRELTDDWRFAGSLIEDVGQRREAFNLILSMPRGSADPSIVLRAAREFARTEFGDHKYVMVLHDHQANPHVHLSVRAESKSGRRLNPRKADLHRWREIFADKLHGWGIDADATRRATRGVSRAGLHLWQVKAATEGRLRRDPKGGVSPAASPLEQEVLRAWAKIGEVLGNAEDRQDRELGKAVTEYARSELTDRPVGVIAGRGELRIGQGERRPR